MTWSGRRRNDRGYRQPSRFLSLGLLFTLILLAVTSIEAASPGDAAGRIQFQDVTAEAGIDFRHYNGGSGQRYLMEAVTGGVALFDYDGDGKVDVYFLNGAPLRGATADPAPRNALYRNLGNFRFVEVTGQVGLGDTGFGLGVAVADYDNDGDPDLYLNNYGPNRLYRNNGDGTFSEVTAAAGFAKANKVGAGACFLDIEGDGDLDLYSANYIKFSYEEYRPQRTMGRIVYPGPLVYPAEPDELYRNNGDGTFTDISAESGIAEHAQWGMGLICADLDNDRDTDIFVCNDSTRNFYFENDGTGHFQEKGLLSGLAFDGSGNEEGSMGVDCADYNGDGLLDLYVTTYQRETTTLYANLGFGIFEDATLAANADPKTLNLVNWGVAFADFDNDANQDLFIANGHIHDNLEDIDTSTAFAMVNQLLHNRGDGTFRDISASSGEGMQVKKSSRGAGFDDLDNDGDVDVVILNMLERPTVLRNELSAERNWIQLRLIGIGANRDGVGARVTVVAGGRTQIREVHSGRGYQSHFGQRLHFGLGSQDKIERIEIDWIGGGSQSLSDVSPNQLLTITESVSR